MRGAAAFTAVVAAAVLLASRAIAAAPPAGIVSEDVPVRGGTAALARAIGVDPALDRARFVAEVARLVYADTKLKRREPQSAFRRLRAYLEGDRSRTGSLAGSRTPPPSDAADSATLTNLVSWEGHDYRIDFVTPEAQRLRRIRERQGGVSIDDAL